MNARKAITEFLLNFCHISLKEKAKIQESSKTWHKLNGNETENYIKTHVK